MSKAIHTHGPIAAVDSQHSAGWSHLEATWAPLEHRQPLASHIDGNNARLLAAAYNAFDSASSPPPTTPSTPPPAA